MASNFTSIPVLDYSQSQGASKPKFIAELREVLTSIGFMQLRNSSVPWSVVTKVLSYADALFNLPMKDKLAFSMSQTPHFLGYNQLGWEITKGAMDLREQVDLAPDYETKWRPGLPIHLRVHGPGVWPKETKENGLIGFREAVLEVGLDGQTTTTTTMTTDTTSKTHSTSPASPTSPTISSSSLKKRSV